MPFRSPLSLLALSLALLAAPAPAHADDVGGVDIDVPGPGGRWDSGPTILGKLNLSLADAIKMGPTSPTSASPCTPIRSSKELKTASSPPTRSCALISTGISKAGVPKRAQ